MSDVQPCRTCTAPAQPGALYCARCGCLRLAQFLRQLPAQPQVIELREREETNEPPTAA